MFLFTRSQYKQKQYKMKILILICAISIAAALTIEPNKPTEAQLKQLHALTKFNTVGKYKPN